MIIYMPKFQNHLYPNCGLWVKEDICIGVACKEEVPGTLREPSILHKAWRFVMSVNEWL